MIGFLFLNIKTCLSGNNVSKRFNVCPPTIEQYLPLHVDFSQQDTQQPEDDNAWSPEAEFSEEEEQKEVIVPSCEWWSCRVVHLLCRHAVESSCVSSCRRVIVPSSHHAVESSCESSSRRASSCCASHQVVMLVIKLSSHRAIGQVVVVSCRCVVST